LGIQFTLLTPGEDNSEMCEENCHVANLEILEVSAGVEVDAKGSKNMNGRGKHPRKIVPI